MNWDVLNAEGIACGKGIESCMGNETLYIRMLHGFKQDPKLDEALTLYRAHDLAALSDCILEIKGVCGNLGMGAIQTSAAGVCEALRNKDQKKLSYAMEELEQSYRAVLETLKRYDFDVQNNL